MPLIPRALFAVLLLCGGLPAQPERGSGGPRADHLGNRALTSDRRACADRLPSAHCISFAGQTVAPHFPRVTDIAHHDVFRGGIRRRARVITVPALRVDSTTTAPQRLVVLPPSVLPASGDADAFVETVLDAAQPYVQQAVGMVVRLHVAVPLLSGQLDQDDPPNASLQRVGEDLQYQREIDGRRYSVVERRYLLIPERSGPLVIPVAPSTAAWSLLRHLSGWPQPLSAAAAANGCRCIPRKPQKPCCGCYTSGCATWRAVRRSLGEG